MPAPAVIPAPRTYVHVLAKTLVVLRVTPHRRGHLPVRGVGRRRTDEGTTSLMGQGRQAHTRTAIRWTYDTVASFRAGETLDRPFALRDAEARLKYPDAAPHWNWNPVRGARFVAMSDPFIG